MTSSRAAAVALTFAALGVAGCGGSSDEGPTGGLATVKSTGATGTAPGGQGAQPGSGGSGGSSGNAGSASTRAAYISRADPVCRKAQRDAARLARQLAGIVAATKAGRLRPRAYFQRTAAVTDRLAQVASDAVEELQSLPGRPRSRDLAVYLGSAHAQVRILEREADALRGQDAQAVRALARQTSGLRERARRAARAFGFKVCGVG